MFVTGVTKLAAAAISKGLNNVTDISFEPKYRNLLGFTKKEIEINFKQKINDLAKRKG